MTIAATEFCAALAAFVTLFAIVVAAGAAVADRLRFPGFAEGARIERIGLALICGVGCLPVALDLAGHFGPLAMTLAALALAALGAPALLRAAPSSLHPGWIAAALIWIIAAIAIVIDMPGVGDLQHSLLAVDYVKHVAATWSLAESGAPPWNPTFHEPGRAMSYYYLFYTLPAVATVLGAPLGFVARHAAYACAPLMGFAIFALAHAALARSGADAAAGDERRAARWPLLALLLATGLDIIPLAILYFGGGRDERFLFLHFVDWDEQVTSWFNSVMWVPHHVAALCAALVGFMALTAQKRDWRNVLLASLAFASMVGQSVYVAMPATLGAALWLVALLWRRRYADVARLCVAGLGALALAAPWLSTLLPRFGAGGTSPIGLHLRGPQWIDVVAGSEQAGALYRGLSMPMFYLIDFGVFALGAYLFWRKAGRRGVASELGLLLILLTAASFLIGSFLRSTILFNDLGWRVMLFAQFAALVWTAAAARQGLLFNGGVRYAAGGALALGYSALVVAMIQLRSFFPYDHTRAMLPDEMAAWGWLDRRLPHGAVVQPGPQTSRAYGYGLYGRFPVALADRHNGRLFGASEAQIATRLSDLGPIFTDAALGFDEARRRAERLGIAALVVSSQDAVFAAPGAWTAAAKPDYENPNFRIYLMSTVRHVATN